MELHYIKGNGLVTRTIASETIVVPVRAHVVDLESIFSMDEVGGLIWRLIDGQTTIDAIVEAVCATYDVGPKEAAEDVREFLEALQAAGLVQAAAAAKRNP